ncbi:MAG: hypothetical protein JRI44_06260 [Deltaproteobacteria bacterium]|nr:hypothetical protein [Deltaproteobacteria bacterium]
MSTKNFKFFSEKRLYTSTPFSIWVIGWIGMINSILTSLLSISFLAKAIMLPEKKILNTLLLIIFLIATIILFLSSRSLWDLKKWPRLSLIIVFPFCIFTEILLLIKRPAWILFNFKNTSMEFLNLFCDKGFSIYHLFIIMTGISFFYLIFSKKLSNFLD